MSQVHKEQLTEIENALPNRAGLDVEIFGMEGVPDDVLKSHQQRVMTQFQQAEAERQAATGNPPAGGSAGGQPAKKPKLENMSEMKRRLAEHRAKRAEGTAGGSSGDVTPVGAGQNSPAPVTYVRPIIPSIQVPYERNRCTNNTFSRDNHSLQAPHQCNNTHTPNRTEAPPLPPPTNKPQVQDTHPSPRPAVSRFLVQ